MNVNSDNESLLDKPSKDAPYFNKKKYAENDDQNEVVASVKRNRWFVAFAVLAMAGLAVGIYYLVADDDDNDGNNNTPVPPEEKPHPFAAYMADPVYPHLYASGATRRATDPVTTEEVDVTINLLFGATRKVTTLEEAEALFLNPKGFGALLPKLKAEEMIYPENIQGFSFVTGKYTSLDAERIFMEKLKENNFDLPRTQLWARNNVDIRSSLRWATFNKVISFVSNEDKEEIIAAELAIERGEIPVFHRYVMADVSNGISDVDPITGEAYQSRVRMVIDVTSINSPFVISEKTEVTREFIGNAKSVVPATAPPSAADYAYLVSFAQALYGLNANGEERFFALTEGTNPFNLIFSTSSWHRPQKFFVQPFRWYDRDDAKLYGEFRNETLIQASVAQYTQSVSPVDGHNTNSGLDILYPPLTMVYSVFYDMVDANNGLIGSEVISVNWYGRGLRINSVAAANIKNALKYHTEKCEVPTYNDLRRWSHAYVQPDLPGVDDEADFMTMDCVFIDSDTDYNVIRSEVANAIGEAWGNEEVFGIQPGVLVTRDTDGVLVPQTVLDYPYDTATYPNHATPKQLEDNLGKHRDIRDNLPDMKPPVDAEGNFNPLGLGKPIETVTPNGPSFEVDGYKVTYDVGVKWKFQVGFLEDAGLTIFNVRFVLPPTEANPEGEEIPYIWKMNIPRFGTTYANSAYGTLFAATYLESHQTALADIVPEANCRGSYVSFPIFHTSGLNTEQGPFSQANLSFYSTYGFDPMVVDPLAELLLGVQLPLNSFPFDRTYVRNNFGVIENGICIQEQDVGNGMWHMYTSQRLRSIAVFSSTVSEAYNVVNRFEFFSNGRIKVSEHLHGYPAIMGHGIDVAGGAYASNGRGGFGSNHMHWSVVSIQPNLKKQVNSDAVVNKIGVSDLVLDHEGNWYGTAYHRTHTIINNTDDVSQMMYDFNKNRAWVLIAEDAETGKFLGSLKVTSNAFGPPPMRSLTDPPSMRYHLTDFQEEDTIMTNWWLKRNVWVLNDENSWSHGTEPVSNSEKLIAEPLGPNCRMGVTAKRCVDISNEEVEDGASLNVIMKCYHAVTTEETPVQNGFTNVETDIWPHNLFSFNPNMLLRQQPGYAEKFQNSYYAKERQYNLPYDNEFN